MKEFTSLNRRLALARNEWSRLGEVTAMSKLGEVRSLMTEALRVANKVDRGAPPELHDGLEHIRDLLDCAVERIHSSMDADPVWPGLAARA